MVEFLRYLSVEKVDYLILIYGILVVLAITGIFSVAGLRGYYGKRMGIPVTRGDVMLVGLTLFCVALFLPWFSWIKKQNTEEKEIID